MVSEVFGEMLFTPPPGECLKEFPSPASLKKRIIISTKPPKEYKKSKDDEAVEKKDRSLGDEEVWGREVPIFSRRDTSDDKVCIETHIMFIQIHCIYKLVFLYFLLCRMIQMMMMTTTMMMKEISLRRMHHHNTRI